MVAQYFAMLKSKAGSQAYIGTHTLTFEDGTTQRWTVSVQGPPTAVVTLTFNYWITNNGTSYFKLNGSTVTLGATINVTLDGAGNGSFTDEIKGGSSSGDAALARAQITATSIGTIGGPNIQQEHKTV